VRHGGIAICAAVSPYRATRDAVRRTIGSFVEVFVDTPLSVCVARVAKGMYQQARAGKITGFTGVDDPYEAPVAAELTLDTVNCSVEENARRVVSALLERGFLGVR